jgi:hypothetical protein
MFLLLPYTDRLQQSVFWYISSWTVSGKYFIYFHDKNKLSVIIFCEKIALICLLMS